MQGQGSAWTLWLFFSLKTERQNQHALMKHKEDVAIILLWALILEEPAFSHLCMQCSVVFVFNCHRSIAVQFIWFPMNQAGTGLKQLCILIKQCYRVLPSPLLQQHDLNTKCTDTHAKPISDYRIKEQTTQPKGMHCTQSDYTAWPYVVIKTRGYWK